MVGASLQEGVAGQSQVARMEEGGNDEMAAEGVGALGVEVAQVEALLREVVGEQPLAMEVVMSTEGQAASDLASVVEEEPSAVDPL